VSSLAHDSDLAPPPGSGAEVWLEDLVGGPWLCAVAGLEGDLLRIEAPRLGHQRVLLPVGEVFTITWRQREVPCEAPAMLVEPPAGVESRGDYLVRLMAPPIRLQRRGAVRVPIQMIVRASARDVRLVEASSVISGLTENVSADGVMVRLERPLTPGDTMEFALQCGGSAGTIQAVGTVVRCENGGQKSRPWRIACSFTDIDRPTQDRLVRHLFERQRELRRHELETS
jgi:PilZ domain